MFAKSADLQDVRVASEERAVFDLDAKVATARLVENLAEEFPGSCRRQSLISRCRLSHAVVQWSGVLHGHGIYYLVRPSLVAKYSMQSGIAQYAV